MERAIEPRCVWPGNASKNLPRGATALATPIKPNRSVHGMNRPLARVRLLKGNAGGNELLAEAL